MIPLMARKHYTDEFRRQVVDLYESTEGATFKGIADDRGIARALQAAGLTVEDLTVYPQDGPEHLSPGRIEQFPRDNQVARTVADRRGAIALDRPRQPLAGRCQLPRGAGRRRGQG